MKKNLPFIIILGLSVALFIVFTVMKPEPVDWSASFTRNDKIPYGSHIPYRLLPDCFPGAAITVTHDSIRDTLRGRDYRGTNYILIDTTLALNKHDTEELMRFAARGNSVFMAASFYLDEFADLMKIRTAPEDIVADRMGVNFANPRLAAQSDYLCRRGVGNMRFISFRKKEAAILGVNERKGANFIRIRHGRGAFYLSALPYAYTNFNMLSGNNAEYVFRSLSYLPVRRTIWDEHYKSSVAAPATPLRYVLSREPLSWAYYTAMAGLVLFMLFKARRRQRAIPVILPPANAALDFATTVGRLYHQRGDHRDIAEKKILYFYDCLYSWIQADALHRGGIFYKEVARRSGVPEDRVRRLFEDIDALLLRKSLSDGELQRLNAMIEDFTLQAKRTGL
ncbi:MAG: hypothetical protein KA369_23210 [Spirochaetes bacterium]|nr:hypothetical protein [Spirochaetota bacterium]